jgi:hypothetical protein
MIKDRIKARFPKVSEVEEWYRCYSAEELDLP